MSSKKPQSIMPREKRYFIKLLLAYAAVLGIVSAFIFEDDTSLDVPLSLPIIILGVAWCFADAAQREHYMGRLMSLFLVLFFLLALPIYLFRTRGLGAFKTLGLTALLVMAMLAIMIASGLATIFVGGATGLLELPAPA